MHVEDIEDICMECIATYSRLNGMHVEDVEDICMECNAAYSRLNDMHVEDDKNTRNVAF